MEPKDNVQESTTGPPMLDDAPLPWRRLAATVGAIAALWLAAWGSGLLEHLDVEAIRTTVAQAGPWGIALFLLLFCVTNLLQLPGMMMIVAGIIAWGEITGGLIAWGGATLACTTTFLLFRALGGNSLGAVRHPVARRLLDGMDRHPILSLMLLRVLFQASAPLNATLAMTRFRLGPYIVGSALGLLSPVIVAALLTEMFL